MSAEPGSFQDDDLLDGCELDLSTDPVTDDELPFVVLSPEGDKDRIEAYKRLFSDHTKAQFVIEAVKEADRGSSALDS